MALPVTDVTSDRVSPGLATLGRALLEDVEGITDRLVEAILAEDPSYTASGRPTPEDLRRSCHDNLQRILEKLADQRDPAAGDPFEAPRSTGHRRAEQGVPLESVLHAYRLGHRTIWEELVMHARGAGGATLEVLVDAASGVWELVDTYSSEVARSYRETELQIARHNDRRRDALIDALLDGRGAERAVAADAATALDLPEHGRLCVVVVAGTEHARRAADALAVRGLRSAWRTRADREVGLVGLGRAGTGDVVAALSVLGVARAGVSPAVDGLADVDVAHRLAATALHAQTQGVAELDAVLPGALLVTAPDLAARLIERSLAPVLALTGAERDLLLETLAAWLDCGGSAGQTARRLFCHRNTVLNRLRRVEVLTGRSLERVDHLVEWRLALLARELLG